MITVPVGPGVAGGPPACSTRPQVVGTLQPGGPKIAHWCQRVVIQRDPARSGCVSHDPPTLLV